MKKNLIYSIAFFMIFLIITLPFYVSDVFAQQDVSKIDRIVYPTPTGLGNASGYMLPTDTLLIVANLRAKGVAEAEVASHVFFAAGSTREPFDSCESLNLSWYDCTFQKQFTGLFPGVYSGNVLLEADDCVGCVNSFQIIVDGIVPQLSDVSILPNSTNAQNLTVSYKATDAACNAPECAGKCSGIDRVVFYPSNNIQQNKCEVSAAKTTNAAGLASGKHSLCISAFDKAGNGNFLNSTCSNITIDREAPIVSTPRITDSAGRAFSYMPACKS